MLVPSVYFGMLGVWCLVTLHVSCLVALHVSASGVSLYYMCRVSLNYMCLECSASGVSCLTLHVSHANASLASRYITCVWNARRLVSRYFTSVVSRYVAGVWNARRLVFRVSHYIANASLVITSRNVRHETHECLSRVSHANASLVSLVSRL